MRVSTLVTQSLFLTLFCLSVTNPSSPADPPVTRHDFTVPGEPGIHLFVREVTANSSPGTPILLLHGARVPGIGSFDLPVPNGSLAADLARRGFDVYVMDVRGYGASTRPSEMDQPPAAHAPLVRTNEAVRDISSVVDWTRARRRVESVALFGWATGGQWATAYATLYPEKVYALVVLNILAGADAPHAMLGHGSDLEDPQHPGHFNPAACGAYRFNTEASLFGVWDRSIPGDDKSAWRDPEVAKAYAVAALASDPTSNTRTPPSFRSPCGYLEDSFYLAIGHQLWDATLITAPTLILASERDFWSRPEDRRLLQEQLVHSPRVKVVVVPNATHFVHLDRPDRGRTQLLNEVVSFLSM
jgi:pimeloyl-ACP methyl ester carboxylesterase